MSGRKLDTASLDPARGSGQRFEREHVHQVAQPLGRRQAKTRGDLAAFVGR
jgi:hypothetical protein